jgi:hypothetical protein
MKIRYRGEAATIHPDLGELVPGQEREIPERDAAAALRAWAAGLPLEIRDEDQAALDVLPWGLATPSHVHTSAQDPRGGDDAAEAAQEE